MSNIPENLMYTKEHEWMLRDGDVVTMGITDHAQAALGDLVFVELPEVGATVAANDSFAVVESVKAASEVYAPVSGEVVEVNNELETAPEQVNDSPYESGWIAKIKLSNPSELDDVLDASAYKDLTEE